MTAILVLFVINNLVWAVLLAILVSFSQNKPILSAFKRNTPKPVEEIREASDEEILNVFKKRNDISPEITQLANEPDEDLQEDLSEVE
jgi:hypothetical protein